MYAAIAFQGDHSRDNPQNSNKLVGRHQPSTVCARSNVAITHIGTEDGFCATCEVLYMAVRPALAGPHDRGAPPCPDIRTMCRMASFPPYCCPSMRIFPLMSAAFAAICGK